MAVAHRFASGLALLAAACSQASPAGNQYTALPPVPQLHDALPSHLSDKSCGCVTGRGVCANLADAIPGRWEGRGLSCGAINPAARTVDCALEVRFVREDPGAKEAPGAWEARRVRLKFEGGGWCDG